MDIDLKPIVRKVQSTEVSFGKQVKIYGQSVNKEHIPSRIVGLDCLIICFIHHANHCAMKLIKMAHSVRI